MRKFKCSICGYVYDESIGIPEKGIAPGTKWEDLPEGFVCPVCSAPKSVFKPLEEAAASSAPVQAEENVHTESIKELSAGEISVICSSLAKGCEKQRLMDEMEAWGKISEYYKANTVAEQGKTFDDISKMLNDDIVNGFVSANSAAKSVSDRGALRSLVWSEKVSAMMGALLERFAKEGDAMLEHTRIYVCDICGFIMLGDAPPEICPVCKVPNYKIMQVERR